MACFLVSGLFWVWFLKWKQSTRVNHNKDSINQASNFIKKRLQHRCFPVINAKLLKTFIWKIFTNGCYCYFDFRRYFRSSSLSGFYKKCIYRSLFSIKLQIFSLKFKPGIQAINSKQICLTQSLMVARYNWWVET